MVAPEPVALVFASKRFLPLLLCSPCPGHCSLSCPSLSVTRSWGLEGHQLAHFGLPGQGMSGRRAVLDPALQSSGLACEERYLPSAMRPGDPQPPWLRAGTLLPLTSAPLSASEVHPDPVALDLSEPCIPGSGDFRLRGTPGLSPECMNNCHALADTRGERGPCWAQRRGISLWEEKAAGGRCRDHELQHLEQAPRFCLRSGVGGGPAPQEQER